MSLLGTSNFDPNNLPLGSSSFPYHNIEIIDNVNIDFIFLDVTTIHGQFIAVIVGNFLTPQIINEKLIIIVYLKFYKISKLNSASQSFLNTILHDMIFVP